MRGLQVGPRNCAVSELALRMRGRMPFPDPLLVMVVIVAAGAMLTFFGSKMINRLQPAASDANAIKLGMSKEAVVTALGVGYDVCNPGEDAEVDKALEDRDLAGRTVSLQRYEFSGSSDGIWIAYGYDGKVVGFWTDGGQGER